MSEDPKRIVGRVVDEVIAGGDLSLVDELFTDGLAQRARRWFATFRASFEDVRMETVQLVAEGDTVVGRFRCSGTHQGPWDGHPPTGRRFEGVDEIYFFRLEGGRIAEMWGLEDLDSRRRQLGITST